MLTDCNHCHSQFWSWLELDLKSSDTVPVFEFFVQGFVNLCTSACVCAMWVVDLLVIVLMGLLVGWEA